MMAPTAGLLLVALATVFVLVGGTGSESWAVACVVLAALAFWSDSRLGRGIVALGLLALLETLGLGGPQGAFAGFGQPAFFFFLALLVIAAVVEETGTARRVADRLLRRGRVPSSALLWRVPTAMVASAVVISSATGRTGLLLPVTGRILERGSGDHGLRVYLTVFLAHLSPLTSRIFLSGGAGVIVAADLLRASGFDFNWWTWFVWIGVPTVAVVTLTSLGHWLWLRPGSLQEEVSSGEPLTALDWRVLASLSFMMAVWVLGPGIGMGPTTGAILGMVLCTWVGGSALGPLRELDWDLVLFLGGTLSLAQVIVQTGTADSVGAGILWLVRPLEGSPLLLSGLISLFVILRLPLHNGVSYSAIVLPAALASGGVGAVEPLALALVVILAASITFLPVQATPAMLTHSHQPAQASSYLISGLITLGCVVAVMHFLVGPYWSFLGRHP